MQLHIVFLLISFRYSSQSYDTFTIEPHLSKTQTFSNIPRKKSFQKSIQIAKSCSFTRTKFKIFKSATSKEILIKNYGLHLERHTNYITSLAISSKSEFIVSRSLDTAIRIWNFREKTEEKIIKNCLKLYIQHRINK